MGKKRVSQNSVFKCQAMAVSTLILLVCLSFLFMLHYSMKQKEILETTSQYMIFENKIEKFIYTNIALIRGYEAYIKTFPQIKEEDSRRYLDALLYDKPDIIRNIGLLDDTTILWSYPDSHNESAKGVDLSKIENQKDLILKVKKERISLFQGPVDLVQGGSGFTIRVPLIDEKGDYWGQISVVLKGDKVIERIDSYATDLDLKIAVSSEEGGGAPFYGGLDAPAKSILEFDLNPELINWRVAVSVPSTLMENLRLFLALLFASIAVSGIIGYFAYRSLIVNYKILEMSNRDFLTGLYNRRFLDEYQGIALSAAEREGHKAAIIMLDLNDFKQINDVYGHEVGDWVLVETARILKSTLRRNEAAFRLGGDEFLIMIPEIKDEEELKAIIKRLLESFYQGFEISGYQIKVSLSTGYALFTDDGKDMDSLLRSADVRLYEEKDRRHKTKDEKVWLNGNDSKSGETEE
ncbi:MAG: sensor domain-containing diguanylate cyclase [Anaerovoracaceae bacterium]|jgi:diguanylate cyclase (GGDEF)-like protein